MFIRNTAVLAGGNILAQVISIALIPVITRIYSTEQFGEFSMLAAIAMILIPISSLRYNAAILLPEKKADSKALLYLSIAVNLTLVAILFFLIWVFNAQISALLGLGDTGLLYFIPLIVLFGGWQLIIEAWALRGKAFVAISVASVGATSSDRLMGIVSGMFSIGTIGLLLGRTSGLLINVFLTVGGVLKRYTQEKNKESIKINVNDIFRISRIYNKFALYSWAAMIQQMARQAPIFLIGIFYSPVTAGLYALCFRVLAEPVQILGAALGRSFAQRAAEDKRNNKDLSVITFKLFKYLLMLIVVPMIILAIIATDVFGVVFGEQWEESGRYVQFVVPVFILTFMLRSLGSLFDVLRKQKDQFVFGISMLVASVGSFMLGGIGFSVEEVLLVYSVSMTIVIGSRIFWFLRMVNVETKLIIKMITSVLFSAVIYSLPVYYTTQIFSENGLAVLLVSTLLVIVYYLHCIYKDEFLRKSVSDLLHLSNK